MNGDFNDKLNKEQQKINPSLDKLIKVGQARKELDKKTQHWFFTLVKITPLIVLQVVALIIIGLDNFLTGTWTWAIFLSATFWYSYASFQTANWIVAITWLVHTIKKFKQYDKDYLNDIMVIQDHVDKDHDEPFLEKQALVERLKRKKEVLENYVYDKMYRIAIKHKIKSIVEYLKKDRSYYAKRSERKAYDRLSNLNEMLSLSWQKQYLKSYRYPLYARLFRKNDITFPNVSRSLIVSGVQPSNKHGEYNTYKSRTFSTSFKMIAPSTITISILALVLLSFQFLPKDADRTTWIKFLVQIMLIIFNTIMILSLSVQIFEATSKRATEERRSDSKLFYDRHKNNNANEKSIIEIIEYSEQDLTQPIE